MNVLFISPGYPPEMPFFTRGLGQTGARVIGVGDAPESSLPAMVREHLLLHAGALLRRRGRDRDPSA